MFRKIFWINVGLFIIIILLTYNIYIIWSQVLTQIKFPPLQIETTREVKSAIKINENDLDYMPSSRMSYSPIVEKNLFRPEREEWQPPPPPEEEEVDLQQSSQYPQFPGNPQQQEIKKPELYGVIIIGDSRKYAIMQGWKRGEPKERTRKVRVGNGQIREVPLPPVPGKLEQENVDAYRVGDYVSEAQVVEIMPEKVIMEDEDGMRYELLLREPTKLEMWKHEVAEAKPGEASGTGSDQQGQIPPIPGRQPYPIPQGVPGYPRFVPAYPVLPPGYVPPGISPMQGRQGYIPQRPQSPPQPLPNVPHSRQQIPIRPGFPPGGLPLPPGQGFPAQMRK